MLYSFGHPDWFAPSSFRRFIYEGLHVHIFLRMSPPLRLRLCASAPLRLCACALTPTIQRQYMRRCPYLAARHARVSPDGAAGNESGAHHTGSVDIDAKRHLVANGQKSSRRVGKSPAVL